MTQKRDTYITILILFRKLYDTKKGIPTLLSLFYFVSYMTQKERILTLLSLFYFVSYMTQKRDTYITILTLFRRLYDTKKGYLHCFPYFIS